MNPSGVDTKTFKKVLSRNIALPLIMSVILCVAFVALLFSLISASQDVTHSDVVIGKMNQTIKNIIDTETGVRGFLITGKEIYLEPYNSGVEKLPEDFAELKKLVSDNLSQVDRINEGLERYKEWNGFAKDIVEKKREGRYKIGEDSDLRKPKMDQIRAAFATALKREEELRDERTTNANDRVHRVLVAIVVISAIVGAFIAWMGRKQLLELSASYQKAFDTQNKQNELLSKQSWTRTGQVHLAEKMRGDLGAAELSDRILNFLVTYLGAALGALYVVDDRQGLIRKASYALPANGPDRFRGGEGLVGQVFLSRESKQFSQLPDHYFKIVSGSGDAPPTHLVLSPFSVDGLPQAVVELGFVESIPERSLNFLNEISELAGTALKSAAYRVRLQELLHQSQQLTEELQTQQEELRVSNEELSERTIALQESQARMESQHAELEQTNEQLEEQAQALEQQKQVLDEQNSELEYSRTEVEQKARELESASQYKSEFLANMSHELRTPLNSSLILAKLLKDNPAGNLSDEQVEFASTIYSSGNDLLNIINDILDLSKVEAGKLDLHTERIPVKSLTESLEKVFRPLAQNKNIGFEIKFNDEVPEIIQTDRQRLEQILKNLLSNAVKFTAKGRVELIISRAAGGRIAFAVQDTGIGIETSQQKIIFEAFRQADGTTNRKYGGTGLGLSISKNLTHLLGGEIEVESTPGQGSRFTLNLPNVFVEGAIPPTPQAPRPASPRPQNTAAAPTSTRKFIDDRDQFTSTGGKTMLIVEDEFPFAKLLFETAHELGYLALVCDSTHEGFELAKKYGPSAIILDMKLSDALGLSLLDRLKSEPKTRHIPVQAISAADYAHEALQMGAIGYAKKPHEREALKELLMQVEKKINQHTKRVLIVEDDKVQRSSMEKLIAAHGVQTLSVASASEALVKLREIHFDCVIMDLSLPDMSGFELLEKISDGRELILPPIIVYTGRSISKAEEDRLSRYSRSIIIKGARSPERLLDEVTLFLHQSEAQLSAEQRKILSSSRNREKTFEGRRILIADDDVRNIFALTSALEFKGAKVVIARNGREAVDKLNENADIDLVLMDIMMPEMNGYEAMAEIRKNPKFKMLPIIAVTAKAMRDDYERCLAAGANDYLAKPIDVDKLVSLMRVWLPKSFGRN